MAWAKVVGWAPLEVGVAGHDRVQIGLGLPDQHLLQVQDQADDGLDLLADIHPEVHRHLIVPAAGGVQPLARVPDALGEDGLDIHVDILVLQGELHLSGLNVGQDGLEAVNDLLGLVLLDDPLPAQHGRVGDGPGDVLPVHPGVKGNGGVEVVDQGIRLLLEPSGPQFHSIAPFASRSFAVRRRKKISDRVSAQSFPCSRRAWTLSGRPHRLIKPWESVWS